MRLTELIDHLKMLLAKYGDREIDGEIYLIGESKDAFQDSEVIEYKPKNSKREDML